MKLQKSAGEPSWVLRSNRVEAAITRTGGHIGPVSFRLDRRVVRPFHVAPWAEEKTGKLPDILKVLRGDFCLVFAEGPACAGFDLAVAFQRRTPLSALERTPPARAGAGRGDQPFPRWVGGVCGEKSPQRPGHSHRDPIVRQVSDGGECDHGRGCGAEGVRCRQKNRAKGWRDHFVRFRRVSSDSAAGLGISLRRLAGQGKTPARRELLALLLLGRIAFFPASALLVESWM